MEKKTKQILGLIAFGVVLYVGLSNIHSIWRLIGVVGGMIAPIMVGFIMAFVLNVPVSGFEKLFTKFSEGRKKRLSDKQISMLSILLTFVCIALVIVVVCTMAIPQIVSSVKNIMVLIEKQWPIWMEQLSRSDFGNLEIITELKSIDIKQFLGQFLGGAGSVLTSLAGTMSSLASGFMTTLLAIVIAIYVLMSKATMARQMKLLLRAHTNETVTKKTCYVATLIQTTYSKFLSGQCVEAIILGTLIFIAFCIFRLPYAGLIAVLTAFFAFIPYVGAFASCVIGAFLIFLTNPTQALLCVVVYLCVQFVENQFIYPRVVGNSVGLSPLWTVVAVIVGGKLFGLIGMLFFIPLTAVLYVLIKTDTNQRLKDKDETCQGENK